MIVKADSSKTKKAVDELAHKTKLTPKTVKQKIMSVCRPGFRYPGRYRKTPLGFEVHPPKKPLKTP